MNIEIITKETELNIFGFSGTAFNKDYAGTASRLSGKMWETVKANNLKNKGLNIWVCESNDNERGHRFVDNFVWTSEDTLDVSGNRTREGLQINAR